MFAGTPGSFLGSTSVLPLPSDFFLSSKLTASSAVSLATYLICS